MVSKTHKSLSMCNIVHIKTTNNSNFFSWKTTIIYSKVLYLILNIRVPIQNFYHKLPNMCKLEKSI